MLSLDVSLNDSIESFTSYGGDGDGREWVGGLGGRGGGAGRLGGRGGGETVAGETVAHAGVHYSTRQGI